VLLALRELSDVQNVEKENWNDVWIWTDGTGEGKMVAFMFQNNIMQELKQSKRNLQWQSCRGFDFYSLNFQRFFAIFSCLICCLFILSSTNSKTFVAFPFCGQKSCSFHEKSFIFYSKLGI
jgi:hypothetical protein